MAIIKSGRDAASAFAGQKAKFLRDVVPPDTAFERGGEDQVVVEIDGREVYFLVSEVLMDENDEAARAKIKAELTAEKEAKAVRAAGPVPKPDPAKASFMPRPSEPPATPPAPPSPEPELTPAQQRRADKEKCDGKPLS